jgi:hypothetical protein
MPFGEARDPESLPACCQEHPEGSAHCLPEAVVPTSARDDFAPCAGGGLCLPDPFIASGGRHAPTPCESALGPGACLSICIPRVAKYAVFLVRDVCASGELCAPCFEPGGGPATGACDLPLECEP